MASSRVTIADVARKAGLSRSAAAYALKNDPNASKATCELVQKVARELGYRPDPMLAKLMSHLHAGRTKRYAGKLAFINPDPDPDYPRTTPAVRDWIGNAGERAQALGYEIEHFWLHDPGMPPRRLARILEARGIQGILLGALSKPGEALDFSWGKFTAVTLGYSVQRPSMPRVVTDHYRNTCMALDRVEERGYRRPGLLAFRPQEVAMDNLHLAAFLAHRDDTKAPLRARPLVTSRMTPDTIRTWFDQEKPDVILTTNYPANLHFDQAGIRVPRDVALVSLGHYKDEPGLAGVLPGNERLGAVAVDLIVSQLHHGRPGIPTHAQTVRMDGCWRDGPSCPLKPARQKSRPAR